MLVTFAEPHKSRRYSLIPGVSDLDLFADIISRKLVSHDGGAVTLSPFVLGDRAAYPRDTVECARKHASRNSARTDVRDEIARMRKAADEKAGSAVMQCIEKREFLARVVRARVG
jgi:hypothetical protein